jgi:hypothetical protein
MNNYSQNSPEAAFMRLFTTYTPHILVGVTVATFLLVGAMQFSYYSNAFSNSAPTLDWVFGITIALVTQAARFALVTNGANHFAHDRTGKGAFSVIFSAAVTGLCSYEMSHLADVWANQNPEYGSAIPIIVQTVIWLGFVLELMIISTVAGTAAPTETRRPQQTMKPYQLPQDQEPIPINPLHNGNGATN